MKRIYQITAITTSLIFFCCNESQRGNDVSNLNETRNEAAAESNTDKFAGKKQKDADFVYDIVASNYGEIKMAELANQRSRTPEIKMIAQKLLTDHTGSLNELKTLAQAKAISVPVEETNAGQRKLENIAQESGEDFDEAWSAEMMDMHEKNIDKFEARMEDTEDAELKAFINKTLPVLREHHGHLKGYREKSRKKNS